ncbi:alkene reductase [Flammeovirga sp. EKP202]|uniref:alkene reductase n=1 Tax=Flammeovirga sp. EKP202 TaxID=2770592 RepID=UPI001CB866D3|nr:alkene reductase [Flammeovirga sp. EKP202]
MKTDMIFSPFEYNGFKTTNRIAMAPMTRARSKEGEVVTDLAPLYYSQRASAGLIITEGVPVSEEARGYAMTPGIYTQAQIEAWKKVTAAVHEKGGKIFIQLWHVGRRATKSTTNGVTPLAPSATKIPDKVYASLGDGTFGMVETDMPKAMTLEDIERTKNDFLIASQNAIEAGFDGVEIHGAHGYLFDQFLRKDTNHRNDNYGGSVENRIRFTMETVELLVNAIGADKVGLRISPFLGEGDSYDVDMPETALLLMDKLQPLDLAYLHFSENVANFVKVPDSYRDKIREIYSNPIILCGNYNKEDANQMIEKGWADMVAFGRPYIVNPDLVERFKNNYPLTEVSAENSSSFYGGGAEGYTDYPVYQK